MQRQVANQKSEANTACMEDMIVSLLLCETLELYYVSCVCGFVSFMTWERSQMNEIFVILVLLYVFFSLWAYLMKFTAN